jgi:hypothetical protein
VTLPTTLATIQAGTPQDHVDWHNEIDGLTTSLGLPTVATSTPSGHLSHHEALHALVGGTLRLDVNDQDPGHWNDHLAIHQFLTTSTISNLTTASDVQAALTAGVTGQVFILAAGKYRPTTNFPTSGLAPKSSQRIHGAYGTTISGAQELTSWTPSGSDFFATRVSGAAGSQPDNGICNITGCRNPHDVFYDGTPLVRVNSQAALATGKFWEDFTNNRVYIRDTPSGHLVEQAQATRLVIGGSSITGVQLSNLILEMCANAEQTGAVDVNNHVATATNSWVMRLLDVRYNHGVGVFADGSTLRNSKINDNGQLGVAGPGVNTLIEDCEISRNNRDNAYAHGWEGGGTKFASTDGLIVRRCNFASNNGVGLWTDINNINVLFEDIDTRNNLAYGVLHEISYAAIIRRVTAVGNSAASDTGFYTGGGIVCSSSQNTEIYDCLVSGRDGIGGLNQDRGAGTFGEWEVRNLNIHDNQVIVSDFSGGWHLGGGMVNDEASAYPAVYTTWGNTFTANRYYASNAPAGAHWAWDNGLRDFTEWQAYTPVNDTSYGTTGPSIPAPPTLVTGPRGQL